MHSKNPVTFGMVGAVALLVFATPSFAQDAAPAPDAAAVPGASDKPSVADLYPGDAAPAPATTTAPASTSLFFAPDEIAAMHSARSAFERMMAGRNTGGESEADFLKKLEALSKPVNKQVDTGQFTYPQFFLSSIVYHSPADWAVWINGEKITQDEKATPSGLKVLTLDKGKVTLEWMPERPEYVVVPETLDSNVQYDSAHHAVVFTLKGNQTFSSYAMKVVEGRVQPAMLNAADAAGSTAPAKPDEASQ